MTPEEHEKKIREQDKKMPKALRDVMSPPKKGVSVEEAKKMRNRRRKDGSYRPDDKE